MENVARHLQLYRTSQHSSFYNQCFPGSQLLTSSEPSGVGFFYLHKKARSGSFTLSFNFYNLFVKSALNLSRFDTFFFQFCFKKKGNV